MKITIRPLLDPGRELDVTHRLIAALAEEVWRNGGGNDIANWLEAEVHLQRLIARADESAASPPASVPSRRRPQTRSSPRRSPRRTRATLSQERAA